MPHEHSTQPSPHAMRAMGKALKVRRISLRIAPLALAIGLTLATTQAQAYGGYGGHRHYGGHYGRSYGYYRPSASGGHSGGYSPGGLLSDLLSIPGAVLGSVFGHHGG